MKNIKAPNSQVNPCDTVLVLSMKTFPVRSLLLLPMPFKILYVGFAAVLKRHDTDMALPRHRHGTATGSSGLPLAGHCHFDEIFGLEISRFIMGVRKELVFSNSYCASFSGQFFQQ
jgi:hypothetical protein